MYGPVRGSGFQGLSLLFRRLCSFREEKLPLSRTSRYDSDSVSQENQTLIAFPLDLLVTFSINFGEDMKKFFLLARQ